VSRRVPESCVGGVDADSQKQGRQVDIDEGRGRQKSRDSVFSAQPYDHEIRTDACASVLSADSVLQCR
jgi:hypothetical protein